MVGRMARTERGGGGGSFPFINVCDAKHVTNLYSGDYFSDKEP